MKKFQDFVVKAKNDARIRSEFAASLTYEDLFGMAEDVYKEGAELNDWKKFQAATAFIVDEYRMGRIENPYLLTVGQDEGDEYRPESFYNKTQDGVVVFVKDRHGKEVGIMEWLKTTTTLPPLLGEVVAGWIIDGEL